MTVVACFVTKDGIPTSTKIKEPRDMASFYKRCGFTTSDDFGCKFQWTISDGTTIEIYGKCVGLKHRLNKWSGFPPNTPSMFGTCAILARDNAGQITSLTNSMINEAFPTHAEPVIQDVIDEEKHTESPHDSLSLPTQEQLETETATSELDEEEFL
jgi:hypothetical protein